MLKIRNKFLKLLLFTGVLTFFTFGCKSNYQNTSVTGSKISVNQSIKSDSLVEQYVQPYREHITTDLSAVLAYAPVTFDKSIGEWQTNIGSLLADVVLDLGGNAFNKQQNIPVDFCLLNNGGIRSIISKGEVTTRTAFEVMPFENTLIVLKIKGKTVKEMASFIIKDKKPHPLSGIEIRVNKTSQQVQSVSIKGVPVSDEAWYYVATSDYLANGGDNMTFLLTAEKSYDVNYKLRNLLIDYFKKIDTLPVPQNQRIILE